MINNDEHIFDGFLFIGDPHIWSLKPGRRRDASFLDTVLNKIIAAANIANQKNLFPIFLGDLFHSDTDSGNRLQAKSTEAIQSFTHKPVTVSGNHDRKGIELAYENPLKPILVAQSLHVMDKPGPWQIMRVKKGTKTLKVLIGGTPYGYPLPKSYQDAMGEERPKDIDMVIWITHDDLAFDGPYPGSIAMEEMPGIDIVVNGHIHNTKRPYMAGETVYHNPGNITRLAIDNVNHIPSVWEWNPINKEKVATSNGAKVTSLIQHVLPHKPAVEIMNTTGYHTKKAQKEEKTEEQFEFIHGLETMDNQMDDEKRKTDDGTLAQETINSYLDEIEASEELGNIVKNLLNKAIQKHQELSK